MNRLRVQEVTCAVLSACEGKFRDVLEQAVREAGQQAGHQNDHRVGEKMGSQS